MATAHVQRAYICDRAHLSLLSTRNDLNQVSSLHVHRDTQRLAILVQLIVLPLLSWALHEP